MKLSELIARLPGTRSGSVPGERTAAMREVRGLTPHLREVRPGMAFFALPGEMQANPYAIQAACERGAALVVCEPELEIPADAPTIQVPDSVCLEITCPFLQNRLITRAARSALLY